MKEYKKSKELLEDIVKLKQEVRMLYGKDLMQLKQEFYSLKLSDDVKDWFWRYIWDEINMYELKTALHSEDRKELLEELEQEEGHFWKR